MVPFRINVSEIIEAPGASIDVAGGFALDVLEVGDERFSLTEPAVVDVVLSNAGSGLVTTGTVTARVLATCSRCLCDFESVIAGEVEGFYVSAKAPQPDAMDAERVSGDGFVDLAPALTAALVIEAPFVPLHDPDCAGLCAGCGANLNEGSCDCGDRVDDSHPFSALGSLLTPDTSEG